MNRHALISSACAAAAALPLAPLSGQPSVTIGGQPHTFDVLVHGTAVATPVLLVGYVSVVDNTAVGEPAYGALATAAFSPYLDDVWLDGSEYLQLASQGLAESVQPIGSSFRIPYWVLEKTMRDYDQIRLQGGPVAELTQARQAGASALHWSPAPAGWSESFPRPIPWSQTRSSYAPPPALDLELAVRALVAHQLAFEPSAGPSATPIGLFHPNVDQVVKAIHSEWGEYTLHLQALVLDPPAVPGGPPVVRITPTSSHGISLPDDPGGPKVLRLVQGPGEPYRYVGMNGVPFAIELRQPVSGPTQMANLAIVLPSAAGAITVGEISTGVGSTWLHCVMPPLAASGTVTVIDRRQPNVPLPLAQPHDSSPQSWADFVKYQAPGGP